MPRRRGFTLVELMAVVSIVGIISGIAIPRFMTAQLRSRATEIDLILGHTYDLQLAWYGSYDCFLALRNTPEIPPSGPGQNRPWVSTRTAGLTPCGMTLGYNDTEFRAPGAVYFTYACAAYDNPDEFSCSAVGDLDADGTPGEHVFCSDYAQNGTCQPSPSGAVSLFPFLIGQVTGNRW